MTPPGRGIGDVRLVPLVVGVVVLATGIALVFLDLIRLLTNLRYYQRVSLHLVSRNLNTLACRP
jgi:hypothetical protein